MARGRGSQKEHTPFREIQEIRQRLETGYCPPQLAYINDWKMAGIQVTLRDYREMAALNWSDLVLWGECESQRMQDETELQKQKQDKG